MEKYSFNSDNRFLPCSHLIPAQFQPLPPPITRPHRVPPSLQTLQKSRGRHHHKNNHPHRRMKKHVRSRTFKFKEDKIKMITVAMNELDRLKRIRLKNNLPERPSPIFRRFIGTIQFLLHYDEVNRET